jgi:dTMP kinase
MALFVVFEGLDGSGKTTQVALLGESLRKRNLRVVMTREPGGTDAGEAVREIMFGPRSVALKPLTWTFLMTAARTQLVADVIAPALAAEDIVIADRYWYSTLAYQGCGDGVDEQLIRDISVVATSGIEPDLVICLDVPPEDAMARKMRGARDVLDRRPVDFHERVSRCYHELARADPGRWQMLDGRLPVGELASKMEQRVLHALDSRAALAAP